MRPCAPFVLAACAMIFCGWATGCATGARPDADVARAVGRAEQDERRRMEALALASADDELPAALPAAARTDARPIGADAEPPAHDAADATSPMPATPVAEQWLTTLPHEYPEAGGSDARAYITEETSDADRATRQGKPVLRFQLMKFNLGGVPVDTKCSIKNKHLVFTFKMTL